MSGQLTDQLKLVVSIAGGSDTAAIRAMTKDLDGLFRALTGIESRLLAGPKIGKTFEKVNTSNIRDAAVRARKLYDMYFVTPLQKDVQKLFDVNPAIIARAAQKIQSAIQNSLSRGGGLPGGLADAMRNAMLKGGVSTHGMTGNVLQNLLLAQLMGGGRPQASISNAEPARRALRGLLGGFSPAGLLEAPRRTRFTAGYGRGPSGRVFTDERERLGLPYREQLLLEAPRKSRFFMGGIPPIIDIPPFGGGRGGGRPQSAQETQERVMAGFTKMFGEHFSGFAASKGATAADPFKLQKLVMGKTFQKEFDKYVKSLKDAGQAHSEEGQQTKKATKQSQFLLGRLLWSFAFYPGMVGNVGRGLHGIYSSFYTSQGYNPRGFRGFPKDKEGNPIPQTGIAGLMQSGVLGKALGVAGIAASGVSMAGGFVVNRLMDVVNRAGNAIYSVISNILTKVIAVIGLVQGIRSIIDGIKNANKELANRFVSKTLIQQQGGPDSQNKTLEDALNYFVKVSNYSRDDIHSAMNELITEGASISEAITLMRASVGIGQHLPDKSIGEVAQNVGNIFINGIEDGFRRMTGLRSNIKEGPEQRNDRLLSEVNRRFPVLDQRNNMGALLGKISQQIGQFKLDIGMAALTSIADDMQHVIGFLTKLTGVAGVGVNQVGGARGDTRNVYSYFFDNLLTSIKMMLTPDKTRMGGSAPKDLIGTVGYWITALFGKLGDFVFSVLPGILNISMQFEIKKWSYIVSLLTSVIPGVAVAFGSALAGQVKVSQLKGVLGKANDELSSAINERNLAVSQAAPGDRVAVGKGYEPVIGRYTKQRDAAQASYDAAVASMKTDAKETMASFAGEAGAAAKEMSDKFQSDLNNPNDPLKKAVADVPGSFMQNLQKIADPNVKDGANKIVQTITDTWDFFAKAFGLLDNKTSTAADKLQGAASHIEPSVDEMMGKTRGSNVASIGGSGNSVFDRYGMGGVYGGRYNASDFARGLKAQGSPAASTVNDRAPSNKYWTPSGKLPANTTYDHFAGQYFTKAATSNNVKGLWPSLMQDPVLRAIYAGNSQNIYGLYGGRV